MWIRYERIFCVRPIREWSMTGSEVSDVVCDRGAGIGGGGGFGCGGHRLVVERGQRDGGGPTTTVVAAAEDEVSAAIASLFSGHAQEYQALSAQAAAFHSQFVQTLNAAAGAYAAAEATNASPLQAALAVTNAPTEVLAGRPLIGNGTNARPDAGRQRRGWRDLVRQWR